MFTVSLTSGKILNITSLVGAFGNINLSTIIGVKYLDVNQNKRFDNGDTPLQGWTVNLTNVQGLVSSVVTNASGFFQFDNLFAGQYNVTEVVQPGYYNVTPLSYSITLSLGKTVNLTSLVGGFGNQQTGCIEGLKYNDTNGNGQLDPGEVGLSGWSINLSRDNVLINSTVTNATGFFAFCNLTAGNYTVSEVLLPGYVNTSPASVNVTLLPGQTLNVTVNFGVFGNALPGTIQGIKYLDLNLDGTYDPGATFITTWGSSGSSNGTFNLPWGVCSDSSGNIYVGDSQNDRVQKFDSNGNFITTWGSSGSGNGEFNLPFGVASDSSGFIYVADTQNFRVQKFDPYGNFITDMGLVRQ